jgi:hypothetical protein
MAVIYKIHEVCCLVVGIALMILGAILTLAMAASVVFLCLGFFGVVALPTWVAVVMLSATATLLWVSTGSFAIAGFKLDISPFSNGGVLPNWSLRKREFFWFLCCVLVVTLGTFSPAIWGILFLIYIFANLDDFAYDIVHDLAYAFLHAIDDRRIKGLIKGMYPGLLWENPDAYAIACLTLQLGLKLEQIIDLRWNQIDLGKKTIRLQVANGQQDLLEMNCDLRILLEQYRKIAEDGNEFVFENEKHLMKNYYAFISWMQNHGFEGEVFLCVSGVDGRRKLNNISEITIPNVDDTPEGEISDDFLYNMDHTPLAQDLPAYIILCCIVRYGLNKDEIANLKWDMFGVETVTIPNGNGAPKIIDVKFSDLKMLQKCWPRRENDRLFEKCELERGFRAASKFMELNGYTAESKIEIERYRYRSYPCESVEGIEEKVQVDLSFLGPNSS